MIILSGLLVIVAIALLVAGIVTEEQGVLGLTGLQLIYVSIAVSIVSALCLAIGVLIRRKELFGPASARPAAPKSRPTGRAARKAAKSVEEPDAPAPEEATPYAFPMPTAQVPDDALVLVIPGRKRYHLDTCRQLAGRQTEELTYIEAQEEGFSPCTACLPDTALAARATAVAAGDGEPDEGPASEPGAEAGVGFTADAADAAPVYDYGYEPGYEQGYAGRPEPSTEPVLAPEPAPEPRHTPRHGYTADPGRTVEQPLAAGWQESEQETLPPSHQPSSSGADWAQPPAYSEPPAADTVTDWDPKALALDPLDPAYPLPEEAYSGPAPLEPRQSGESWSTTDTFSDAFWTKDAGDSEPTPDQGTPLPEPVPAEPPLSDSILSEPVQADPAPEPSAEVASVPDEPEPEPVPYAEQDERIEPAEQVEQVEQAEPPADEESAPEAEDALTTQVVPAVPGSREPEAAPAEGPVVRILSGTKRYHRPDCALIEDIGEEDEDLETLSRATAKERGCTPCLVCQPDKEPAV